LSLVITRAQLQFDLR